MTRNIRIGSRPTWVFLFSIVTAMLTSCNVGKHLAPGEKVLYDNSYDVKTFDGQPAPPEITTILKDVKSYTLQTPNSRVLGIKPLRFKMWVYSLASVSDSSWWDRYLHRQGQAPVIYDINASLLTAKQLEHLLESKGCFNSQVTFDTTSFGKQDVKVQYHIKASPRRIIDEINYSAETQEIIPLLNQWRTESLLQVGDYYDQSKMVAERDRIAEKLSDNGYYKASKDLINYLVDTTYSDTLVGLELHIQNPTVSNSKKDTAKEPLYQYEIGNISIDSNSVKLSTIERVTHLTSGQPFSAERIRRTYSALQMLKNFKYINIELKDSPLNNDSIHIVDAHIRLRNNLRHKLSASLEFSNASPFGTQQDGNFLTNGNFGLETILGYQNRNLFGGAEQLKVEGSLLLELPKLVLRNGAAAFHEAFSAFESGLDVSLDIPKFLIPFAKKTPLASRTHTLISIGGNYQYRTYFERILWNTGFGYVWNQHRTQHQLRPIELTYVNFLNLDPEFMGRLEGVSDLRLKYQYSDHFIMGARYNYVYSNQNYGSRTNFSYLNASVETAGNLLNGLSLAFDGSVDSSGIRQFLNVPYSQYLKTNIDAKRYFYHGKKNTFVARLLLGIGIPYGNSMSLPYEKSFFGGGPTTMRAWQLRHLGPGSYNSSSNDILERVGDMTFVMNLEERFPIVGVFEGAIFADIGNVWLMHPSEEYPQGNIRFDRLLRDMAVGVGVGLRINVSILTVRADFAIALCDPGYDDPWRMPYWRFNQVVTNFGIDYPF